MISLKYFNGEGKHYTRTYIFITGKLKSWGFLNCETAKSFTGKININTVKRIRMTEKYIKLYLNVSYGRVYAKIFIDLSAASEKVN